MRNKHSEKPLSKVNKAEIQKARKFACDQCDKKFFVRETLEKHKFSHSKTRPYNCTMCSTGYYMNEYLRKHYLREHGVFHTAKEIRKLCGFKKYTGDSD